MGGESYPDGTDGVDPTTLPRNTEFEAAIISAYDAVRVSSGIPDNETVGVNLKCTIYQGLLG